MTEPPEPATPRPQARRRGGRAFVVALVVLAVLGVVAYLIRVPAQREWVRLHHAGAEASATAPPAPPVPATPPEVQAEIAGLQSRVASLETRVASLAKAQPSQATQPTAPPAPAPASAAPLAATDPVAMALATRMDAIGARQDRLDAQLISLLAEVKADEARLATAAAEAGSVAALSTRTATMARLQSAQSALAQGEPLGIIPGAPPALARFQNLPPPTETALRLQFPTLAAQARAQTVPEGSGAGFWHRIWTRIAGLVTIRRGDRVLLGSRQIGLIDAAQTALDAGDLAGAVRALGGLTGPQAAVLAPWRDQAQELLDARAALAKLVGQA
jgi:hypothetical protein